MVVAKSIALKQYEQTDRMPDLPRRADCPPQEQFKENDQKQFQKKRTGKLHSLRFGMFLVNWGEEREKLSKVDAEFLDQLPGNLAQQENLRRNLEELNRLVTQDFKLDLYANQSPLDRTFYTTNINIANSGVYDGQRSGGAAGAVIGAGPDQVSVPYVWVFCGMIRAMANKYPCVDTIVAHEFSHTVSIRSGRYKLKGWSWLGESYADFIGNKASRKSIVLEKFHESRALGLDCMEHRYAMWIWWDFLSRHPLLGYDFTADVLLRNALPGESCFSLMRRILPCQSSDPAEQKEAFANLYGEFARSAAFYAYYSEPGLDYLKSATRDRNYERRWSPYFIKTGENRYRIADWLAPQRFGFNAIELVRQPGQKVISVDLKGWAVPERESEWRASLVAKLKATEGKPQEAWTEMWKSGTFAIDLEDWERRLGSSIETLDLVVAAVPKAWREEGVPAMQNAERYQALDRYVYELQLNGAWIKGTEPLPATDPALGSPHPNGGGFVAKTASVAATAYVGPEARVLGNAQVLEQARIEGRAVVEGHAVISGRAIISSSALVGGTAQVKGMATVRDHASLQNSAVVEDNGSVLNDGIVLGTMHVGDWARFMGATIGLDGKASCQIKGTSLVDGDQYLHREDKFERGSAYDKWKDTAGLLARYKFEVSHPYRVKDQHGNSDGYYLGLNGEVGPAPHYEKDSKIRSLVFDGTGAVELPRWLLDSAQYRVTARVQWTGNAAAQILLEGRTALGERWALGVHADSGDRCTWTLEMRDRQGHSSSLALSEASFRRGDWVDLSVRDDSNSISFSIADLAGKNRVEKSMPTPFSTREWDYDSLQLRLGADTEGNSAWDGKVADLAFYR